MVYHHNKFRSPVFLKRKKQTPYTKKNGEQNSTRDKISARNFDNRGQMRILLPLQQ